MSLNLRALPLLPLLLCLTTACDAEDEDPDDPATCAVEGEAAGDKDCCEGLTVDFTNTCLPCVPLNEMRSTDGPGCCGDLIVQDPTGQDMTCTEP